MAPRPDSGSIETMLDEIDQLPGDWHGAGVVNGDVLRAIGRYAAGLRLTQTAETGTGKTTLLFSHLSPDHKVFTKDDRGDGDSLRQVTTSPLLKRASVEFILGPTQRTVPGYAFTRPFQMVFLDGPHAYPFPEIEYYHFYPHLEPGALLIIDDIHIPTISRLFEFLREDEMFDCLEVVHTTAFLRRSHAPAFDPLQDGWWLQAYNKARFPLSASPPAPTAFQRVSGWVPRPVKSIIRRLQGLSSSGR